MVKGISRRVVVVDAPEHRFFEQAIFIVTMTLQERGSPPGSWWRKPDGWPTITRPAGPAAFPTGGGP